MGTAGIQKALVKNAEFIRSYGSHTFVELNETSTSFTAYLDETCLGRNTTNPRKTMAEVKWLLVRQHIWLNYKKLYPDLGKNDFFNKLTSELSASDYSILSGNDLNFTRSLLITNNSGSNLGAIHILMPYTNFPEYEIGNIFVVALSAPKILYAQFKFPKHGYIPLQNQEKRAAYGQTIEAVVYTHLLPDWRKSLMKFEFEVELINKGDVVSKSGLKFMGHGGDFHYNNKAIVRFLIDAEWQKKHEDKNKDEEFYLRIKGTEAFSTPTFTSPDTIYNSSEYNSQADTADWMRMEDGKWVYDSSRVLLVPYDTFAELMSGFEVEKNEMIQYIGDIEYEYQEYDPCGYKKIKIKCDDRQKYIFDEDKVETKKIDETAEYFEILAGDTAKEVVITVENLQKSPSYICTGVLLQKDEQHDTWEKIFQMGNVQPAEHKDTGYQTVEDKSDPAHQDDRDVYASTTKAPSKNVASSQMLQFNVNYFKEGENGIKLKLPFKYNKTVAEGTVIRNTALDQLWLFRYFWITEDMVQKYFVPIATCRYPNQIAKIKVYPDISWTFHINYGMKNPIYYRDTWVEMRQHRVEDAVVRAQAGDIDGYDGTVETKFSLSLEAKWNGTEAAKLDQKISEKVKLLIGSFIKIKQFVDKVTGRDRGNSIDGASSSIAERMRRVPLSIEVLSPQITLGAGWEFKKGREEEGLAHRLAPTLGIVAKADPVIGAEAVIDLIAWGKKLHPGAYAVITALDLLAYAANAEVRFDLKFYGKLVIDGNVELSRLRKEGVIKAEGQFGFELYLQATATEKFNAFFTEVDVDFEAKAQAEGYFSLGLSAGMDDYKGIYFQPIIRHSGIKIILSVYVKVNGFKRTRQEEYIVIAEGKAGWDDKYYFD